MQCQEILTPAGSQLPHFITSELPCQAQPILSTKLLAQQQHRTSCCRELGFFCLWLWCAPSPLDLQHILLVGALTHAKDKPFLPVVTTRMCGLCLLTQRTCSNGEYTEDFLGSWLVWSHACVPQQPLKQPRERGKQVTNTKPHCSRADVWHLCSQVGTAISGNPNTFQLSSAGMVWEW